MTQSADEVEHETNLHLLHTADDPELGFETVTGEEEL